MAHFLSPTVCERGRQNSRWEAVPALGEPRPRLIAWRAATRAVPFTLQGLRNSYISAAVAAGVHPYRVKLLVNHSVPKADVTADYLSRDVDCLREPQQRITDWLLAAVGTSPASDNAKGATISRSGPLARPRYPRGRKRGGGEPPLSVWERTYASYSRVCRLSITLYRRALSGA
jgi:hypothetical protein